MTTASWNRRTEAQTIASSTLAQLPPLWLRGRRRFLTLCKGASGLGSHPVRAHASSSAEGFSPFHSAGGPPVTSILPARPPMRGREKKDTCGHGRHRYMWTHGGRQSPPRTSLLEQKSRDPTPRLSRHTIVGGAPLPGVEAQVLARPASRRVSTQYSILNIQCLVPSKDQLLGYAGTYAPAAEPNSRAAEEHAHAND